jgi:serine/threonine protein kinase
MDTSLPLVFPDYDIEEEIGCGNLTTVYRARRKSDGRPVSIKLVIPEFTSDPVFVRRFVEAGSRAIRLDHPNIARVYEVTEREGAVYVIREYLEADCLAEWIVQQGRLSPAQAVPLVRQLASALDYAHSRRAMHGDINDRCIYVDASGHVKLADFGLVQSVAGTDLTNSQGRGVRMVQGMGAPEYLAPERVQGQGPSRAADIYALGVVAYHLLTGHPPFSGESEVVMEAQVYQTPAPVHADDPHLSPTISAAVTRALAKRPELRYNTATEFARAFAAAAEGIAPGRGSVAARPKPATSPRKPPTVLVAVVLAAIAVTLLAWDSV